MKNVRPYIPKESQERSVNIPQKEASFYDRIVEVGPINIGLTVFAASTAYMFNVPTVVIGIGVGGFILYKTVFARSVKTVDTDKPEYSTKVNRVIKSRILAGLQIVNQTFAQAKKETIAYNEQDSIDQLATQTMQGYLKICQTGLKDSYLKIAKMKLAEEVVMDNVDNEALMNGVISWITLQKVYETDKKTFPTFRFKKNIQECDVLVKGIDPIIDNGIRNFKVILEKYFSVFRTIMDPGLKLETKINLITNYNSRFNLVLQLLQSHNKSTEYSSWSANFQFAIKFLTDALSSDIFALQNILECLYTFKKVPKTLFNLEKGFNILNSCYNTDYKNVLSDFSDEQINNRLNVRSLLKGLTGQLSDLIQETETQIRASLKEEKKLRKRRKALISQVDTSSQILQNKTSNNNSSSEASIVTPLRERNVFEIREEKQKKHDIGIAQRVTVKTISDIKILPEESSEDDLEGIEPETIVLMEAVRQFFEKDRAIKLKLKEEKSKKAKIVIEDNGDLKINIKSENQILGNKHQKTLAELFQTKPGHLTILGKSVKSLIKALGGKSIGATGSQFTIFWSGSNKHAGEYEVTHGGDTPGYLTSEYAARVADAIHIGVKHNCIAKDLFPDTLLTIIENHAFSLL